MSKTINRRGALAGAAAAPVALATRSATGNISSEDHPDAVLIGLWKDWEAATAAIEAMYKRYPADYRGVDEILEPFYVARDVLEERIVEHRAETSEGLVIKLRIVGRYTFDHPSSWDCLAGRAYCSLMADARKMGAVAFDDKTLERSDV